MAAKTRLAEDDNSKGQKTRRDILNCAVRHFVLHGVAGASLREIAKEVGISRPALYYYFKSKDEVLRALVTESAEQVAKELSLTDQKHHSPTERLQQSARVLAGWILSNSVQFLVADRNEQNLPPALSQRNYAGKRRVLEFFESVVRDGISRGDFRPVNSKVAALSIIGMCTSTARWFNAAGALSIDEIAAAIADLSVASVVRPGPRRDKSSGRAAINAIRQELDYLESKMIK